MRRRPSSRRAAVLFVFVGAAAAAAAGGTTAIQSPSASAPADLIVTNGAVYAADGRPMRQAVAVRGTEIVLVGSNEEIARLRGPGTTVVDAHGGAVVPGFNDVHAHMLSGGLEMDSAALQGAQTPDELQSRIRSYAAAHPQALWIRGRGWGYGPFGDKTATREQLDAAIADRPAIMRCFDG